MGNFKPYMDSENFKDEYICGQFQLGSFKRIIGKMGGVFNTNIKIETSEGTFVLRILNEANTMEHLRYIEQVLPLLRNEGLPVLEPILALNGNSFISYRGKLMQVSPFISADSFQCRENQVYSSGDILRAFHRALEHTVPGPKPQWSFYRTSAYLVNSLKRLRTLSVIPEVELSKVEKLSEQLLNKWNSVQSQLPETILHGDWHFWNLAYSKDQVACIMDFDYIQKGKRIHDVAYALWVIYMLLPEYAKIFDRALLSGYGKLTDEEQAILPVAIARIALFILCQAAYSSNPLEKWNKHYQKQVPFIRWLMSKGEQRLLDIMS
jgi:Ser/Thr protein kinase RdoA (MazF antagonist)